MAFATQRHEAPGGHLAVNGILLEDQAQAERAEYRLVGFEPAQEFAGWFAEHLEHIPLELFEKIGELGGDEPAQVITIAVLCRFGLCPGVIMS
jgi:hypothetical protein